MQGRQIVPQHDVANRPAVAVVIFRLDQMLAEAGNQGRTFGRVQPDHFHLGGIIQVKQLAAGFRVGGDQRVREGFAQGRLA